MCLSVGASEVQGPNVPGEKTPLESEPSRVPPDTQNQPKEGWGQTATPAAAGAGATDIPAKPLAETGWWLDAWLKDQTQRLNAVESGISVGVENLEQTKKVSGTLKAVETHTHSYLDNAPGALTSYYGLLYQLARSQDEKDDGEKGSGTAFILGNYIKVKLTWDVHDTTVGTKIAGNVSYIDKTSEPISK
jgi:hypothetical protein